MMKPQGDGLLQWRGTPWKGNKFHKIKGGDWSAFTSIRNFYGLCALQLLLPGLKSTTENPLQQIKLSLVLCFIRKEITWF